MPCAPPPRPDYKSQGAAPGAAVFGVELPAAGFGAAARGGVAGSGGCRPAGTEEEPVGRGSAAEPRSEAGGERKEGRAPEGTVPVAEAGRWRGGRRF